LKKSKHTDEQVVTALKKVEAGLSVRELARQMKVSEATIYNWKAKFGGMQVSEVRRLRDLEAENARLKRMYADLSLAHQALQDVLAKKF
jgi:putative transposase